MTETKSTATKKKSSSKKNTTRKKTLVIVESPAKAKTIEKYLGSSYVVRASMGHLIDLPKSRIAIDEDNDFEPDYITVRGRTKLLKELEAEAKKSKAVLLASDNDREGEAIAWHLKEDFEKKFDVPISRIVFNEITPQVIKQAVENPQSIDDAKVDAQKARRVLDRLVGYKLSPLLWKKVKNGVSAGRVQSVALRLICERETEVENFIPEEYWTVDGKFSHKKSSFVASLVQIDGKNPSLKNEAEAKAVIDALLKQKFTCTDIKETDKSIKPKPPLTTSKLQQMAANRLGFTSKRTMQIAQQLYEGVLVGSRRVGLITYMRTDSVRISPVAIEDVRNFIAENYPDALPEKPIEYSTKKNAQDAHEAIRPTYSSYTPEMLKSSLTSEQLKLYSLIWESFLSCQMVNAVSKTYSIEISAENNMVFKASSTKLVKKGFYSVQKLLLPKEEKAANLPNLNIGDEVSVVNFVNEQHFTQGPARFSDASIVKLLEEKGIGRPSTYAPTISLLLERYYVTRSNKQLIPTVLGKKINEILTEYFSDIVNVDFTAQVENQLDLVEAKEEKWNSILKEFYPPFKEKLENLMTNLESMKGSLDEVTDEVCEKCGLPMVKKLGKYGYFLACSGFPGCRNSKSIPICKCPRPGCNGFVVKRSSKGRRKEFYGCTLYPVCDFLSNYKPTNIPCPKCGQPLVEKFNKKDGAFKSCINPKCDYLHTQGEE